MLKSNRSRSSPAAVADRSETMRIETPRAYLPLLTPARYKGLKGGRGAGRSNFFAEQLIARCLEPGTRAICLREHQVTLEQSVKRLLEDKIEKHKLGKLFRVQDTEIVTPGDGLILFKGLKSYTADSIKSLEGYRYAWVEEAQTLSQRSLDLLRPTIRLEAKDKSWSSELWFSWNPSHASDPIERLLCGPDGPPPGSVVVHTTYKDNPWFPDVLRREMEWDRSRDPEKYAHVWLGEYEQQSVARVFKNWRVEEFATPADAAFLFGADWGFATDPSTAVRGYVIGRTLFIDAEVYRVGCDIDDTPALFDGLACTRSHVHDINVDRLHRRWNSPNCSAHARSWTLVADSARPETISYMQRHGYPRIIGAKKGPGSVEDGVEFLKSYDIVVHPRCTHVIDELSTYAFKTHPLTGSVIPVLLDAKNHMIDALRYMLEPLRVEVADGSLVW